MKLKEIGEFGLINKLSRKISNSNSVIKGIGDDAAVLEPADKQNYLLMTTDMLVEDVHFSFKYSSPEEIGYKTLAVNISDIAAMGGIPTNCTIAIAIPSDLTVEVIEGLYKGLNKIAKEYGINIVGGDTVKSNKGLVINLTLLGEVNKNNVKYRSGAKVHDLIGITGYIGGSAAGLQVLAHRLEKSKIYNNIEEKIISKAIDYHLAPKPQVKAGNILSGFDKVHAMNDISDGLASELHEISSASKSGFVIYGKDIPIDNATLEIAKVNKIDLFEWPLYGGEDYQLVFTCCPSIKEDVINEFKKEGLNVNFIGEVVEEGNYKLIDNEGIESEIYPKGYNHFV